MSIIPQLAISLNIRSEIPNIQLAERICKSGDTKAVKELVENLGNTDKNIQSGCIKVLYEIGEREPKLIATFDKEFLALLDNKNNRLVWGAMTALDGIATINPNGIYKNLGKILTVADKGSVITKDHAVNILIKLATKKKYTEEALALLLDHFRIALVNQLPKYAEDSLPLIPPNHKQKFINVLSSRLKDIEKETLRKRVDNVIKKLGK
jgi:hypothetical protein